MHILFITTNGIEDSPFGGAKGSRRNYFALLEYGDVDVVYVDKVSNIKSAISILEGRFPPYSKSIENTIIRCLARKKYEFVFFDNSCAGRIVKIASDAGIRTVVFYHNCEYDYIDVRFGTKKTFNLKAIVYKYLAKRNERIATKYADHRIAITKRDASRIKELYNETVDSIIPTGMEDKYVSHTAYNPEYCLLFGPVGTANIEAFSWFKDNVSPFLNCKTLIAGKGFDKYEKSWSTNNVRVIGYVDDINELYAKAFCVAIPLLSGGGMKLKTVEALMFGKYIFGTAEAFIGFDDAVTDVSTQCCSPEEFVNSINNYIELNHIGFNKMSRDIYVKYYSTAAGARLFGDALKLNYDC